MEFSAEQIEQYRRKLTYKVRFHVGSFCPDVDDLAQESLTRLLTCLNEGKLRDPNKAGAFLSGICNNVIHEYLRKWRREPSYVPETHGIQSVPPEMEHVHLREAIRMALGQLSTRDRTILREFYLEERSKEDICRDQGFTDPQFRLVLFRAKRRFRDIYENSVQQRVGS